MSLLRSIYKIRFLKYIYKKAEYTLFVLSGKRPWGLGYQAYKEEHIRKELLLDKFDAKKLPHGYGFRIDERIIEYPWLFSRLPLGKGNLLDAGSVLNLEFIISEKKLDEKKLFISTLAPENFCLWEKGISYVYEDLRGACYRDNYFDYIVSLSTVEHIGLDNTILYTVDGSKKENRPSSYLDAIKEFRRILKPGGVLYLSVPFGKYKNHGWFQVFDGEMIDRLIGAFSPTSFNDYYFKYEQNGWHASTRESTKDATCFDIHFQKTYDPDYAAFSRGIVCLEMIK
ncbi:MAG: methyltransferase domain-containing protein [Nitrospira sp.]|nr:methyltransferase domain-containing protein [Nitrospira sp.]